MSHRYVRGALRQAVLDRDGFQCRLCGKPINEGQRIHFDHIIPASRGGPAEAWNLRVAHSICNLRRSASASNAQFVLNLNLPTERGPDQQHVPFVLSQEEAERKADSTIEWLRDEWRVQRPTVMIEAQTLYRHTCLRCGRAWFSYLKHPKQCRKPPGCGTRRWDKPGE